MKKVLCGLVIILALCLLSSPAFAADGVPEEALAARESVFRVYCEDAEYIYSGSSFVISSDESATYLATSYHVIEDTDPDSIELIQHDGSRISLSVAAVDEDVDLCVLKSRVPLRQPTPLVLAPQETIAAGNAVYALGFPGAGDYLMDEEAYRIEDITLTNGIINAVKHLTLNKEISLIQMNAAINPGSSGGPLVNSKGQVVGISTLVIADASDVYAAVSVEHLKSLLDNNEIGYLNEPTAPAATEEKPEIGKLLIPLACLLGAGALAALIVLLLRRRLTLETLLQRRLRGYSTNQALAMIAPLLGSLRPLHTRGLAHGGIHPGNIFVGRDGQLRLGRAAKHPRILSGTKPYLPGELYDLRASSGTYSDVYALGALLYALIFGKPPADMMQRMQCDSLADELDAADIPVTVKIAIYDAMRINAPERIQDVFSFAKALEIELSQTAKPCRAGFALPKLPNRRTAVAIAVGAAVVLVLTVAAGWTISEQKYGAALRYADDWDFLKAGDSLYNGLLFYKDTDKLSDYIQAGEYLDNGYFSEAKAMFAALGDYRDSKVLVLECDYRLANDLLKRGKPSEARTILLWLKDYGDSESLAKEARYREGVSALSKNLFSRAREIFAELAKSNYKDADDRLTDVDYREALYCYNRFVAADDATKSMLDITAAQDQFKELGDYSDSKKYLHSVTEAMYAYAKYRFDPQAMYLDSDAQALFQRISDYKDSSKYLSVYAAYYSSTYESATRKLKALWSFQPAREVLLNDTFIYYFLKGTWKGNGHSFKIYEVNSNLTCLQDFSGPTGEYYKISDMVYYVGSDESGWSKHLSFAAFDTSTLFIYSFSDGKAYQLKRQ